MSIIGNNLRRIRKSKGLNQQTLSRMMGYTNTSTIAKIETGVNDVSTEHLFKLATVLEVPVNELLKGGEGVVFDMDAKVVRDIGKTVFLTSEIELTYDACLNLIEGYEHDAIKKPKGMKTRKILTAKECFEIISKMQNEPKKKNFGKESRKGQLAQVLDRVFTNADNKDGYYTFEEQAARLLYELIKEKVFLEGNKRIAAMLFLEFLNKNLRLYSDSKITITNNALATLVLLIYESKPEEKDLMIRLTMRVIKGEKEVI